MRPLRGIALKLASVLIFIVMASLIKATAQHVPAGQAVFFRSLFAIPVIVVWLIWRQELATGLKADAPAGPCLARRRRHDWPWAWALRGWAICPCPR